MTTGKRLCRAVALAWILFTVAACVAPMPALVPPTPAPPASPTTAAGPDLLGLAKAYEDAYNRNDIDALLAMFTEKGSFDPGRWLMCVGTVEAARDVPVLRECFEFTMTFKPRLRLSACQVKESQVICQAVEQDEWTGLLFPQGSSYSEYAFTFADSKIAHVVARRADDEVNRKLFDLAWGLEFAVLDWSQAFATDEYKKAFKTYAVFDLTTEAAKTWLSLTKQYLATHPEWATRAIPAAPVAQDIARGAPFHGANGLFFDKNDRLHIASVSGREIIVMDPDSGKILDRIGPDRGVESPDDLTFGPDGSLYWTALMTGEVGKLTPDGQKVTVAQGLMGANPITFSDDGRLFVARDFMGAGLYELDPNGVKPPRPIDEKLVNLNAFDFGPDGKLYGPIFISGGKLIAVDVDSGAIHTAAEGFTRPVAAKFDAQGRLFTMDQAGGKVYLVNPTSGQKTEYATIEPGLDNLAFDSKGRMFVSNASTAAIYEVRADGTVRTVSPGGFIDVGGIAVLPRADGESVYVPGIFACAELDGATGGQRSFVQAPLGASPVRTAMTLAADGTRLVVSSWFDNAVQIWDPATNAVSLDLTDVAVPLNAIPFGGDIVVAELGTRPPRVVRISAADPAQRTTLAEMGVPAGLAATAQDLWATDWAAGTVVQILKGGQLLTPPAVVASGLKGPEGLAVAPDGSLLVVEALAGKLSRIILPAGTVSAVAEGLELGAAGPPTMPPVWIFDGVAVGPSGAIYVGGDKANVVYRIEPH